MNTREQTEDLKAFEQRLTECVGYVEATTSKWRILIVIVLVWLVISIWNWWRDDTQYVTYLDMLKSNQSLSLCLITICIMYITGVFDRSRASKIITQRCRNVLRNYNISCDEQGKLILKRTPRQVVEPWRTEFPPNT